MHPAVTLSCPQPFLNALVEESLPQPVMSLCANYEQGRWRASELSAHLVQWLPEFALSWAERDAFGLRNGVELLRRAARTVYETDKYRLRGEFGELLLHGVLRSHFGTEPGVAKLAFKTAANDTVKGFDVVHIVDAGDSQIELWLGEAKFYSDLRAAIRDAVSELHAHLAPDYLRTEFMLITNKLDPGAPFARELRELLDAGKTLDDVFHSLRIPVLLTYESPCVQGHSLRDDVYLEAFRAEALEACASFWASGPPDKVSLHLILVPLHTKQDLIDELHTRLTAAQTI
jgi:hypothetical protein